MYDIHRLRLLRELSYRKTLAAVAQALDYSPSAVSHQLSVLEREVGVQLLEPVGRGVRLTPAAEVLVGHAEAILLELEKAEASIAASRDAVTGTLRLATFQTAAHTIVPDAIRLLRARHPELRVDFSHISAEEALPALLARDFDLVLWEQYPGLSALSVSGAVSEKLADDPLFLAIPQDWEAQGLADLSEAPWVLEHPGTDSRSWAIGACRAAGFEARAAYESSDVLLHGSLAGRGLAVAFLPRLGVQESAGFRLVDLDQNREIMMSRRAGSEANPAIAALGTALRAAAALGPSDRSD